MKKILFILTICFFYFPVVWAQSAENYCNGLNISPKVSFSTSYGQLHYNFSKNTKQISRIATKIGNKERSIFASGLATIDVENEYALGTRAVPSTLGKGYCIVPENIQVYVGFARPVIYISNELERGSCKYNLVVLHEKTHQRINKATLDFFIPYFEMAVEKIGKELSPIYIQKLSDIDNATDNMTQEFTRRYDKILNIFKKELAVEQGKLDNQINYKIEDDICAAFSAKHLRR